MRPNNIHTIPPHLPPLLNSTQLPNKQGIKDFKVAIRPTDTRAHGRGWERGLKYEHSVLDHGEVDVRDGENVLVQIAIEDTLTLALGEGIASGSEVDFSRTVFEAQADEEGGGGFSGLDE